MIKIQVCHPRTFKGGYPRQGGVAKTMHMMKELGAGDADFGNEEIQQDMFSKERSKIWI